MTDTPTGSTTKTLRRSTSDRIVGGVAGGVARYLGFDPVLVRIVMALTMLLGGIGFVAYVLAWILLPADDSTADEGDSTGARPTDAPRILGAVLVFIAAASVLDHAWWAGELVVPVALIAVGAWLIFRPDRGTGVVVGERPSTAVAPPVPPVPERREAEVSAEAVPDRVPPPVPPPVEPPTDRGFPTAQATAGVMALTAGGLWIAEASGADISLESGLLVLLALCGAGLVVGAFTGRARPLIGIALVLALGVFGASAIDVPLEGGVGERRYEPADVTEVEDEYRLGVGEMVLDLRAVDPSTLRDRTASIEASIVMGSLEVLLPPDVATTGDASAQVGDVEVFGESQSGTSVDQPVRVPGAEGAGVIELDLQVGIGEIRVR